MRAVARMDAMLTSLGRSRLKYRVLVRGTLHRDELVESSSLHVLPSAFGSTVFLLSEVFGCGGDCKSEVAKV